MQDPRPPPVLVALLLLACAAGCSCSADMLFVTDAEPSDDSPWSCRDSTVGGSAWVDEAGHTCGWFGLPDASGDTRSRCATEGQLQGSRMAPLSACCACGGGVSVMPDADATEAHFVAAVSSCTASRAERIFVGRGAKQAVSRFSFPGAPYGTTHVAFTDAPAGVGSGDWPEWYRVSVLTSAGQVVVKSGRCGGCTLGFHVACDLYEGSPFISNPKNRGWVAVVCVTGGLFLAVSLFLFRFSLQREGRRQGAMNTAAVHSYYYQAVYTSPAGHYCSMQAAGLGGSSRGGLSASVGHLSSSAAAAVVARHLPQQQQQQQPAAAAGGGVQAAAPGSSSHPVRVAEAEVSLLQSTAQGCSEAVGSAGRPQPLPAGGAGVGRVQVPCPAG